MGLNRCPHCGYRLDKASQFKEIKLEHSKTFLPWSKKDDLALLTMVNQGKPMYEISDVLERPMSSVKKRIDLMGLEWDYKEAVEAARKTKTEQTVLENEPKVDFNALLEKDLEC